VGRSISSNSMSKVCVPPNAMRTKAQTDFYVYQPTEILMMNRTTERVLKVWVNKNFYI